MLKAKVALVTGGAQGIGRAFSDQLLKNGAKVLVCDLDEKTGSETVAEFRDKYGSDRADFAKCDVSNSQLFEDCFKKAVAEFGGLDVVINNAGICDERDGGWKRMIDINLTGVVTGTKLGLNYMGRGSGGRGGMVINIASFTALGPFEAIPVYSATKAAVNQLSRSYGTDLHYKNSSVKVMAINPGLTNTKILEDAKERCVSDQARKLFPSALANFPLQGAENMGKGLIEVILKGENGSLWTIQEGKAPEPTVIA